MEKETTLVREKDELNRTRMNKKQYHNYLKSKHWQNFRQQTLAKYKRCSICHTKYNLQINHVSYKNIGKEMKEDISVLCGKCHKELHFSKKGNFISMPSWERIIKLFKKTKRYRDKVMS